MLVSTHRPRKRFGQNFLTDQGIIEAMVSAIAPSPGQHLLEIGPGQGALTQRLLAAIGKIYAIEIDRDLADALQSHAQFKDLALVVGDALTVDLHQFPTPLRVVGNLPYNVATAILLRLVALQPRLADVHVMLQKEVADRLAAIPNTKAYGRISVLMQYLFIVEPLFEVPPQAFMPQPKVTSAVVRLRPKPLSESAWSNVATLSQVAKLAFSQRRKTLRNNLNPLFSETRLSALGLDPHARAESLSVDQFSALSQALADKIV